MAKLLKNMSKRAKLEEALVVKGCVFHSLRSGYRIYEIPTSYNSTFRYFLVGSAAGLRLNHKPVVANSTSSDHLKKHNKKYDPDLLVEEWESLQREKGRK
jgi:hypothetical protein